jgi:hypothetical protein
VNGDIASNGLSKTVNIMLLSMVLNTPVRLLTGKLFEMFSHSGVRTHHADGPSRNGRGLNDSLSRARVQPQVDSGRHSVNVNNNGLLSSSVHPVDDVPKRLSQGDRRSTHILASRSTVRVPEAVMTKRNVLVGKSSHVQSSDVVAVDVALVHSDFSNLSGAMQLHISSCLKHHSPFAGVDVSFRASDLDKSNARFCAKWGIIVSSAGVVQWESPGSVSAALAEVSAKSIAAVEMLAGYSDVAAGAEMIRLFMEDMLGRNTRDAKIFRSMYASHITSGVTFSPLVSSCAFAMSLLLNIYFFYTCVLYAAVKSVEWQNGFLLFAASVFIFIITVEMPLETLLLHYVIPSQILNSIRVVQYEVRKHINSTPVMLQMLGLFHENNGPVGDIENNSIVFASTLPTLTHEMNAHAHLSVASAVAAHYKHILEGMFVVLFKNVNPRRMLESEHEADALAAQAYMGLSGMAFVTARLASVTLVNVLIWVGSQSMVLQKVLVNAPFPILSSVLTGIIYLVSSQSALVVTGVIGAGGALVVLALVNFGYYLKDLAEEDDKRDAEDRVASRDARGSRIDTEAVVKRSAHRTGVDGAVEGSLLDHSMLTRSVTPSIPCDGDDAVVHAEDRDDVALSANLCVGKLSHGVRVEGEDLVQSVPADVSVSIAPLEMSTTDKTPVLATEVLVQASKAEYTKSEDIPTSTDESMNERSSNATKSSKKISKTAIKSSKMKGESTDAMKHCDERQVRVPVEAEVEWEDVRAASEAHATRLDSKLTATTSLKASASKRESSVIPTDPKAFTTAKRSLSGTKRLKYAKQAKCITGSSRQSVKAVVKGVRSMALKTIHVRSDVGPASNHASDTGVNTKVKTIRRPKKKKAKRVKRVTRVADSDAAADDVVAAVGKLSLSIAKPKRRASRRISVDKIVS